MTSPLALVLYEELLPGSQLVNRLQDLGYRVTVLNDARQLVEQAAAEKPMIVFADLFSEALNVGIEIKGLRLNPATEHIPVVAFADPKNLELQKAGQAAGANLVVTDATLLQHLPQFLEQALAID